MADVFTREKRSEVMALIRSKNTKPERKVRKALHHLGYRFRIHVASLPGKPDIVLRKYQTVIHVRGCFWHGHHCRDGHKPKSKLRYWGPKLEGNKQRDKRNDQRLRRHGWSVLTVWECKCRSPDALASEMKRVSTHLTKRLKALR